MANRLEGFEIPKWVHRGLAWKEDDLAMVVSMTFISIVCGSIAWFFVPSWATLRYNQKVFALFVISIAAWFPTHVFCLSWLHHQKLRRHDAMAWVDQQLTALLDLPADWFVTAKGLVIVRIIWLTHLAQAYRVAGKSTPTVLLGQLALAKKLALLSMGVIPEHLGQLHNEVLLRMYPEIVPAQESDIGYGLYLMVRATLDRLETIAKDAKVA